jgi:protein-tyrosine phosphatase
MTTQNPITPPPIAPSSSQQSTSSNASTHMNIPFSRLLSPIDYKNLKFLVLDCPTEQTIHQYVKELKSRGITDVVRVCEPTYQKSIFEAVDIQVHDWPFKDGGIPPVDLVSRFLSLVDERFNSSSKEELPTSNSPVIAVHCVAGLGRAPVLVAIALIEAGMIPLDTIEYVRKRRRGAFNSVQLQYLLEGYKKVKGSKKGGKIGKRGGSPPANPNSTDQGADKGISIFGKLFLKKK